MKFLGQKNNADMTTTISNPDGRYMLDFYRAKQSNSKFNIL